MKRGGKYCYLQDKHSLSKLIATLFPWLMAN